MRGFEVVVLCLLFFFGLGCWGWGVRIVEVFNWLVFFWLNKRGWGRGMRFLFVYFEGGDFVCF